MTLGEMIADVTDNVRLAGLDPPAAARIVRLLNRAKNIFASQVELSDSELLVARTTISISAGATSFALPTDRLRIISLERTDSGEPQKISILDAREASRHDDSVDAQMDRDLGWNRTDDLAVYIEGDTAYFARESGAPACTLRLRTRNRVADLAETAKSSSYGLPAEWHHGIVAEASAQAIPRDNAEYGKHRSDADAALARMTQALARRVADRPICTLDRSRY